MQLEIPTLRGRCRLVVLAIAALSPITSLAQTAPTTPTELLKWSMRKYAELPSFQAECTTRMAMPGLPVSELNRSIQYVKPNRYKIVSKSGMSGVTMTSVCDGKKVVEFMTGPQNSIPAQTYNAPESLGDAKTMFFSNPYFCASLLYHFFGGPGKYDAVVNESKMPVAFGKNVTIDGAACKTVKFWAQGTYGSAEAAIGEQDGLVHQIIYHSEPLLEQMRKLYQSPEFLAQMKKSGATIDAKTLQQQMPKSIETTESFSNIQSGQPIEAAVFSAQPPAGQQITDSGSADEPKPPVPLGNQAPEIRVKSIDGSVKRLTDLRGRVVMIDFWATWCPPCRKGLPETQAFYKQYGSKGLEVLTISDEPKGTVTPFLKSNKFTFPAYLDQQGATNKAYHIEAIPTVAIIDRNGRLSAYFVGLRDRSEILAALKRAGLDTK